FYLYNNKQSMLSAGHYSCEYLLRLYSPSKNSMPQPAKDSSIIYNDQDSAKKFFSFPTKFESSHMEYCPLKSGLNIHCDMPNVATILRNEIKSRTGINLGSRALPEKYQTGEGIFIISGSRETPELPPDGFRLDISPRRIIIRGRNERGCLFGIYTLVDRLTVKNDVWRFPCVSIKDWPDVKVRVHITEIMPTVLHDVSFFKRYLAAVSRARGNTVIFYFYPRHIRQWKAGDSPLWWSKKEMEEISGYARSLYLDVWAGLSVQLNSKLDKEFDIASGSNFYNPFNPDSYEILFNGYTEIIRSCRPSTVLIGHDEMRGLSEYSSLKGTSSAEILAADINKIHQWLKERNLHTAVWG
ncbi:hypothetical protein EG832_20770, partial [bacterium]|nr:hypothetical protein [bacterium]